MAIERMALTDDATGAVNIVLVDTEKGFEPGPGKTLRPADGAIQGGTWDGQAYQPAPPPPPDPDAELSAALAAVQPAISAVTDPEAQAALQALMDALTGNAGRAGKVAGRPT